MRCCGVKDEPIDADEADGAVAAACAKDSLKDGSDGGVTLGGSSGPRDLDPVLLLLRAGL